MNTATISRILISVLVAAAMAPALYWVWGGFLLYGSILIVGGLAILLWLWKPWRWWKKT